MTENTRWGARVKHGLSSEPMAKRERPTYTVKDAQCVKATELALLVKSDEIAEPVWVPLSQVDASSEVRAEGDAGDLIVSEWLALQKGWL